MPKTADKFLPEKYKVAIHGENSMSAKRTSNVSTEITSPELFRTHKNGTGRRGAAHTSCGFNDFFLENRCPEEIKSIKGYNEIYIYKDKCLLFVKKEKTWAKASSACKKFGTGLGGNLVTIPDIDTMLFIMHILNYSQQWINESLWIGLHIRGGRWKWASGIFIKSWHFD